MSKVRLLDQRLTWLSNHRSGSGVKVVAMPGYEHRSATFETSTIPTWLQPLQLASRKWTTCQLIDFYTQRRTHYKHWLSGVTCQNSYMTVCGSAIHVWWLEWLSQMWELWWSSATDKNTYFLDETNTQYMHQNAHVSMLNSTGSSLGPPPLVPCEHDEFIWLSIGPPPLVVKLNWTGTPWSHNS